MLSKNVVRLLKRKTKQFKLFDRKMQTKIFNHIRHPNPVLYPQVQRMLQIYLCVLHPAHYHLVNKHVVLLLLLYQHSHLLPQLAHHLALSPVCQHLHIHHQGYHHHLWPALVSLYSLLIPALQYRQIILWELMKSTLALELMTYLKCKILLINLYRVTGILPLLTALNLPLYLIYVVISQPIDNPSLEGGRKTQKYK